MLSKKVKILTATGLFVYLCLCGTVLIYASEGGWKVIREEARQATVSGKRTSHGHYMLYVDNNGRIYKFHNVGPDVYSRYKAGDTIAIVAFVQKYPVVGFTRNNIRLNLK